MHAVRDWILVQWNDQWRWPNFNIADSLLVVGAVALVCHAMRNPRSATHTPDAASDVRPLGVNPLAADASCCVIAVDDFRGSATCLRMGECHGEMEQTTMDISVRLLADIRRGNIN